MTESDGAASLRDSAYEAAIQAAWESISREPLFPVRAFSSVSSTMDAARQWAKDVNSEHVRLVVARNQTQGRGRRGRRWSSEEAGLYATFIYEAPVVVERLAGLSLVVGVATVRMLEKLKPGAFGLKWPNDVLFRDGKKVAGTLIELLPRGGQKQCILIGIGVNCTGSLPAEVPACTLQAAGIQHCDPATICALLARELLTVLPQFCQMGFTAYRDEWIGHALFLDSPIAIADGTSRISGIFQGLDETGAIVLRTASGERIITVGDVEAL